MRYVIAGLALMVLAGCGVKPPIEGRADPFVPVQITLASADLANKTAIGLPQMERRNGILYVTVPIRAATNHDLHIDYRVTFINAQGRPVYQGPWEHETLEGNVQDYLTFNSLSGEAADFRLELRYAE